MCGEQSDVALDGSAHKENGGTAFPAYVQAVEQRLNGWIEGAPPDRILARAGVFTPRDVCVVILGVCLICVPSFLPIPFFPWEYRAYLWAAVGTAIASVVFYFSLYTQALRIALWATRKRRARGESAPVESVPLRWQLRVRDKRLIREFAAGKHGPVGVAKPYLPAATVITVVTTAAGAFLPMYYFQGVPIRTALLFCAGFLCPMYGCLLVWGPAVSGYRQLVGAVKAWLPDLPPASVECGPTGYGEDLGDLGAAALVVALTVAGAWQCDGLLVQRELHIGQRVRQAIREGNLDVLRRHRRQVRSDEGRLFSLALVAGHAEVVEFFIKNGADVNRPDDGQWTPLHEAASRSGKGAVQVLLDHGADIHTRTATGETPLHAAAASGQDADTIGLLIARGADVNARTYHGSADGDTGETPLDMAERFTRPHTAALLRKHGGKRAKEL